MDGHAADAELSRDFVKLGRACPQDLFEQHSASLGRSQGAIGSKFLCCVRHGKGSVLVSQKELAADIRVCWQRPLRWASAKSRRSVPAPVLARGE